MKRFEYSPGLTVPVLEPGETIRVVLDGADGRKLGSDYIEVSATEDGSVEICCGEGFLAIRPQVSNCVRIDRVRH